MIDCFENSIKWRSLGKTNFCFKIGLFTRAEKICWCYKNRIPFRKENLASNLALSIQDGPLALQEQRSLLNTLLQIWLFENKSKNLLELQEQHFLRHFCFKNQSQDLPVLQERHLPRTTLLWWKNDYLSRNLSFSKDNLD